MGKLLVIEGMDGAGTTTQTKMLSEYLTGLGMKVVASSEPTNSALGQEIRKMLATDMAKEQGLLISLALCFAADRMQHLHHVIAPGLRENDFVILDRYVMSSLVYQGLHLPTEFVNEINRYALKPDLTLVLDVDPKTALARVGGRKAVLDFYESLPFLERIRTRYLHFAQSEGAHCVLVDASDPMGQVHSHIVHIINTMTAGRP